MLIITLAIILTSITFAPLGSIVLWRRYVNFSDGLAHSCILAGAISILVSINIIIAGSITAILFALLIFTLQRKQSRNAIIILISSSMLATALILGDLRPEQLQISNLLFGDILAIEAQDLWSLLVVLICAIIFIYCFFKDVILITLDKDIAEVYGIKAKKIEFIFLCLLALSVFLSIKIVGSLLISSMLIIPAMTARLAAKDPIQMIIYAALIAIINSSFSLILSFYFDLPFSPLVVLVSAFLYGVVRMVKSYET